MPSQFVGPIQPPPPSFSPAEIKELVAAGALTAEDIKKMNPAEQALATKLMAAPQDPLEKKYPGVTQKLGSNTMMGNDAAKVMGPGMLMNIPGVMPAISKVTQQIGPLTKTGATMYGINKVSDMVGAPPEIKDILMMLAGMKGMTGPYKGAGLAAEEAAVGQKAGRVAREAPSSDPVSVGDNVHRGVTNDWGSGKAVSIRKPEVNLQAPSEPHDRMPSKSYQPDGKPTSNGLKMPTGAHADYQSWSDAQDAKFLPQGTSIEELRAAGRLELQRLRAERLKASMDKSR